MHIGRRLTPCKPALPFRALQAVVTAAAEENLYAGGYDEAAADVYPAVLVALTSAAGVGLARRLQQGARLGPAAAWLLQCIYAAKLSMLAIPQARPTPLWACYNPAWHACAFPPCVGLHSMSGLQPHW